MNDPNAKAQLARGFYDLEGDRWRWTAANFSVLLKPPPRSIERGATLKFAFSIPDAVIHDVGCTTLTVSIDESTVASEQYTKAGAQQLTAYVPANLLKQNPVRVNFFLNAYIPAGAVEGRELGVIATSVGLQSR